MCYVLDRYWCSREHDFDAQEHLLLPPFVAIMACGDLCCHFAEKCLGSHDGTAMHRSHDYFCVADAYTGSERRIPVCATAKVLLTRMGLHKYEMTISWVYSKRPGRTWKQTICAKPQIHIKDERVKQPQIDASTSPGDVSKKVVDRGARGRPRKRQPKVLQKRGRPKKAQALLPLNSVQKARRGRPKLMGLKKGLGKRQRRGRPRKMQRYSAKKHTDSKRN